MTTPPDTAPPWLDDLRWTEDGLIPAIVQDAADGSVLMLAWMNREALALTLSTGEAHYYSRSRRSLWHKGGTSGHVQEVVELRVDCDADVLLLRVRQTGAACHEGYASCFFRRADGESLVIDRERRFDPDAVYGK